ncbi:MAG TPA: S-adenosylmethionine decarboxylase [Chitinophagaceae bacterium]|nr:S-adenosylmethionine decarboxylase [Chitinophagaceae bacterium]
MSQAEISYKPSGHLLLDIHKGNADMMSKGSDFLKFVCDKIAQLELHIVGKVLHEFDGGGFTAVICLTESHLSVHTWPEFERCSVDIFLSNYKLDNADKSDRLAKDCENYFGAQDSTIRIIER